MQSMVNFFAGQVRLEVTCPYPERFMNLCAQNDVGFWDLVRVDALTVQVTMRMKGYRKLRPLLQNLNAEVKPIKRAGVPVFWRRVRRRYVLLAGLILTLAAIWIMNLYIWDIRVEGNETIPAAVILSSLDELGVGIGTFGPSVETEALRNQMLLRLEDLAWITVNLNGSRATVIVRERVHAPQMFPEGIPTAVYATQSGVIEQMTIWAGTPLVEVGSTVVMGQDLITGRMESAARGSRFVRADAEIFARTWHELSMSTPLEQTEKVHTGETSTKNILFFGQRRINLFLNSGISHITYDKIVNESDFHLPGGIVLPIRLERRIYAAYEPVVTRLDETTAALFLQEQLMTRLETLIGSHGQVLRADFEVEIKAGIVTVHLRAETREQIAAIRRMREDELVVTPLLEGEDFNSP